MAISRRVEKIRSQAERTAFHERALSEAAEAFTKLHGGRPKVIPGKYGGTVTSRWIHDVRLVAKILQGDGADDWCWIELQARLPANEDGKIAVLAESSLREQPTVEAWTTCAARAITRASRLIQTRERGVRALWGSGPIAKLLDS